MRMAETEAGTTYRVETADGGVEFVRVVRWENGEMVCLMPARVGEVTLTADAATHFVKWERVA